MPEELTTNETALVDGLFDISIPMAAIDSPAIESAGSLEVPIGVWKVLQGSTDVNSTLPWIFFDQNTIDPYSCTLVGSFTALANKTGKIVPQEIIEAAFEEYVISGKFTKGVGWLGTDGASFALSHFNKWAGTNIQMKVVPFNASTIIEALSSGSPINTGIHYGANYFKQEQTGAIVNGAGIVGQGGHWISIVKANTEDSSLGLQLKYAENYFGEVKWDIIYVPYSQITNLFFNSGVYYV